MKQASLHRILMVEDEPDIQAVARLALEAIGGFDVRLCSSGAEAIAAGPAFGPDLILLDVMMPGMDGPTTLHALRQLPRLTRTPVVFLTAKVQPSEIAQYKALGVLDVISKPFDPLILSETIKEIWRQGEEVDAGAALQSLSRAYAARLPDQMAQLEQAWGTARRSWSAEDCLALKRLAHNLSGTGATLGFPRLSEAAGALDCYLATLDLGMPVEQQRSVVERLVGTVLEAGRTADLTLPVKPRSTDLEDDHTGKHAPAPAASLDPRSTPVGSARENRLIYIVGLAPDIADDLAAQLGHFGYEVRSSASFPAIKGTATASVPAAVILAGASREEIDTMLGFIREGWSDTSLVLVSGSIDMETRLHAVRAGIDAFFPTPLNVIALVDKLDQLTAHHAPEPYRVLIVEDEPELAKFYAMHLLAAGMRTDVVTDPLDVLRPLAEFHPDVILMDMYMPRCDGLELAAIIRQQEDYIGIPIVFLSAETNRDMQLEAMRLGGDDFMTKPILPDHLISAVNSRVARSRALRSLMVRDSLTGLYNHTATKERLEIELARARRNQTPVSLALIDIDHFKSVNDTYGHPVGDRVLKSLARLLQQRLRGTDIIGRYGGEEFAVVLANSDADAAFGVMDKIRADLAHVRQQSGDRSFSVTFSCGIAGFPHYPDISALTDAADRALYAAKRGGRNRVVLLDEDLGIYADQP
jgi:diguanylate cyclase (GGDEF)-like protein